MNDMPNLTGTVREQIGRPRRGWLRHGNPPGDLATVCRCGARTRSGGSCRQPAMKNGRCRFHGGKSTGPRTPAGLARSRAARYVHGGRSAELITLKREAWAAVRRLAFLTALARRRWAAEKQANRAIDPMSGEDQAAGSLGDRPASRAEKGENGRSTPCPASAAGARRGMESG